MLTLQYLKTILTGTPGINNVDDQIIESEAGYDGILALLDNRPHADDLVIVLEHCESGSFEVNPGGVQHASQTIWVMSMVAFDENRRQIQDNMFSMMRRVVATLISKHKDPELEGWDNGNIPWFITNSANNYTGYQFTLHFDEVTNLTLDQFANENSSVDNGGNGN